MLTQPSGSANEFVSLLDTLPDTVFWLKPVAGAAGQPADFQIAYSNAESSNPLSVLPLTVGTQLLADQPTNPARLAMADTLRQVVQTGTPYAQPLQDVRQQRWYHTTCTRLGEGVLVVLRHLPDYQPTALPLPGQTQLANLIDSVQVGLLLLEPVRDSSGHVIDLLYTLANDKALQILGRTRADTVGQTLLTMYPGADTFAFPGTTTGESMLARYVRQLREGGSSGYEFLYDRDGLHAWFQTTAQTLPDRQSLVLSFIDITASKETEQSRQQLLTTNEQQRTLLQSILDAAQTLISVHEPIRDAAGQVQDFRITLVNRAGQYLIDRFRVDITRHTLRDLLPSVVDSGLLNTYIQVADTGKSAQFEGYVAEVAMWVRISAASLGDTLVVTCLDVTSNHQMLLAQERQATFLNTVIDASPTGIMVERAIRDETGQVIDFLILSANAQAAVIVQSGIDELVGKRDMDLHPGLRDAGNFALYVRALETGLPQQLDTYYDDGRLAFWVHVDVRPIASDEIVITFTDISEHRRTTREIQAQTALLNNVLDASTNGIMSFTSVRDDAGRIVDFAGQIGNEAAGRLVGQPIDALIGSHLCQLFPAVVPLGLFDKFVNTVETGQPTNTEFHTVREGTDIYWTVSARRLNDGFVVTFADVSELRLATLAIEASVVRLQTIINQSQTDIALLAPMYDETDALVNFRYTLVNQTLADYFGKTPADLIGSPVSDWFTSFRKDGVSFGHYQRVLETGEPVRFDLHYIHAGHDMWLDVMATRMDAQVLISSSNYTSLKYTQQQLENSVIDLQRSNRNLEQFAYVASHDLQEPLRKIRAFGDMLQEQYRDTLSGPGINMIDRMQSAAARMQTLIRDVLTYSRLATQREAVGPVSLPQLLDDLRLDLETSIADQQATLQIDPLPVVQGDAVQLRQLFQNLMSNALKFQRPGIPPILTITTRTVYGRDAGMDVSPADEGRLFHQIELTDNGIGFAPEYAERIFQVFQRLHSRDQYNGTGIGLAIVEKVVQNHQGYIKAEGRPGNGATFRVLLPA